jgi:hypothetical protein
MSKRIWLAWTLFALGLLVWVPGSDLIKLIVQNDEVVLGRYSRGHFGAVFLLTLLLWIAAGVIAALRRKPVAELVFALVMIYLSTGVSMFLMVVGSGLIAKPRYIEESVDVVDVDAGIAVQGTVRHRPPHERYELIQRDVPEQVRSYPDAPPGYPEFPVILTTDSRGFRNVDDLPHYNVVAVGDSFVAGSHVSDHQAWADILRGSTGNTLYNLGVSGSDLLVYLNNFVTIGRPLKPTTVLLMVYEGNDFRDVPPLPEVKAADAVSAAPTAQTSTPDDAPVHKPARKLDLDVARLAKASPVTKGLKRLSAEVLSQVGQDWPVPGWETTMGWMPLAVDTPRGKHYYSFEPKRLVYLNQSAEAFAKSEDWRNARAILDKFVTLARHDGFRLVVVYAPSAPHVVLPLSAAAVPADSLMHFAGYKDKSAKGDAEAYKRQLLANLDSQENTVMAWCRQNGVPCLSTTAALRDAARAGDQVYFTYDQHWTPEGNAVVARLLHTFFQSHP